ncbi:MAG TPA: helix-turn-helix transcriptional regulator [Acidimicrobiales bacterium]|nr:helix-turn-helix transcriptional regulator [Acidimicrobiales bacterium]
MAVDDLVRARDRIIGTIAAERSAGDSLCEILAALHEIADFDSAALMLTDPETMLPSGAAVEGFPPESCVPFWDNELLDPDFLKFNELARSHDPIGTLYEATDGDLERSPRYRRLLAPFGAKDELRVAFSSGTTCWAVGALVRPAGMDPFTPEEVRAVRDLIPVAARSLRHAVSSRSELGVLPGPGMLVVDASGRIDSMTPDAEEALFDLQCCRTEPDFLPTSILAAAVRARSSRSSARVAVRARGLSGTWMKVHASPLGDDGRVAVMIEPARRSDLLPILLESYDLTARESEVILLISRGLSTKDIAAELCISAHTVNDHIKVIFAKVGVTSRGELVAKLFSEHVIEPFHEHAVHV